MSTARGGRKPKKAEDKCSQTVKTTVTESELSRLQLDYQQETIGQQVSFAEYIRQRLSRSEASREKGKSRNDGLAIQLALAEIIAELRQVNELNKAEEQGDKEIELGAEMGSERSQPAQLTGLTSRLEDTIEQISTWLYGSLPEKI